MSKVKMIKALFLAMVLTVYFPANCFATYSDSIIHSSDWFYNDYPKAVAIQASYNSMGRNAVITARPSVVYGLVYQLSICPSLYICSHGTSYGSQIILGDGSVVFNVSDVPTSMGSDFVYYGACKSALTNTNTNLNLCSTTVTNGATAVVGYVNSVDNSEANTLEISFYNYSISPSPSVYIPVSWSLAQAKSYTNSVHGQGNSASTGVQMFGNGGYHF